MGKLLLLFIVAGGIWAGYNLWQGWGRHMGVPERVSPENLRKQAPESKDRRTAPDSEPVKRRPSDRIVILSSSSEFVQVEGWGVLRVGDMVEGGRVVVSWADSGLVLRDGGRLEVVEAERTAVVLAARSEVEDTEPTFAPFGIGKPEDK